MRASDIRNAQRAQPFQPFVLHLADGREFLVAHPEFIFVGPIGRLVVVESVEGNMEIIDPMLITSISVLVQQSQAPGSPG